MLHVINIVIQPAYLYLSNPISSTVTLASSGTCVERSATSHLYVWGHLLNPWGPPLKFWLRLVLGG